jgi:predicted membrane-bound spermidine synthase
MNFVIGMLISVMLLFFPSFLLFGLMSPLLIDLISTKSEEKTKIPSYIFSISTIGGVLGVYLFGFYTIPFFGINSSFFILDATNVVSIALIYFSIKK